MFFPYYYPYYNPYWGGFGGFGGFGGGLGFPFLTGLFLGGLLW